MGPCMRPILIQFASVCLLTLGLAPLAATAAEPAADLAGYERIVKGFVQTHCVSCHGPDRTKGGLALDGLDGNVLAGPDVEIWQQVADRLILREMPPSEKPQPTEAERDRVLKWLSTELAKAGRPVADSARTLSDPAHGNRVNHDLLFDPALADRPVVPAPPRLWRLGPKAYERLVYRVTRSDRLADPFTTHPGHGIKDYAALYAIDEPTTQLLLRNAHEIAKIQAWFEIKDGKPRGRWRSLKEAIILLDPANDKPKPEQVRALIDRQFREVCMREPTDEERNRYAKLFERTRADAGLERAVTTTLSAVLLRPEVVYRWEIGTGKPDAHGRIRLTPRQLVFALTFALTDDRPRHELLRAAEEGKLDTRDGIAEQVRAMFENPKLNKPRILRFFHEYFEYHHAPDVFKETKDFADGGYRAEVLVHDTDQLVEHILAEDRDVFRRLLTTNLSFVNYRVDRKKGPMLAHPKARMHLAYNVDDDKWTVDQPMRLPGKRAGVLTQPAWLIAWSGNFDNDPIRRGKWVRERLLGGSIPNVPITVDAQLPDEPHHTLRQRLRITRKDYCWQCHRRMNPLGLPFELYDHFGRMRSAEPVLNPAATEANVDKKVKPLGPIMRDVPLDTTGSISASGDALLDGDIADPVEMIHRIADSDRGRQVFIRHVFRYFMGRNENPGDAPTLINADRAYVESGGSFRALVVSLLSSDSFCYRFVGKRSADIE